MKLLYWSTPQMRTTVSITKWHYKISDTSVPPVATILINTYRCPTNLFVDGDVIMSQEGTYDSGEPSGHAKV